jgi:ABC-2 type transport system permease protein
MRNTWIVLEHEIKTTLAKRSFWLTTFLFPLLILALTLLPQLLAGDAIEASQQALLAPPAAGGRHPAIGYVDLSGLVQRIPPDLPPGLLQRFDDEAAALAALQAGQVFQVYLAPADFMQSGALVVVPSQFSPLVDPSNFDLMEYLLAYNLLGDADLARRVLWPGASSPQVTLLAPAAARRPVSGLDFGLSFAVMFILFFTITLSSGYMLQSVVKEKENRTAEVLLLSLSPVQLMLGKILGLGAVALLQMGVWLGGGLLLLGRGQALLGSGALALLPDGFVAVTVLYFLLGYALYASALGALGALAPNLREGSQYTFILLLPLLAPIVLNSVFVEAPDGLAATVLSLFPLTSPTAMPTRLVAGDAPAWQIALGLALLAATAFAFVLLAARFFRADTLLSDAALDWRRVRRELKNGEW